MFMPGSTHHNALYRGHTFHSSGEPQMQPVQPGVAGRAYLDSIDKMVREIRAQETGKIVEVGKEMGQRAGSNPAVITAQAHMVGHEFWGEGKWFQTQKGDLETALGSGGMLIFLGYYNGVPQQMWDAVRRAKAKGVWALAPALDEKLTLQPDGEQVHPGQELDFKQYGDVFINQHWDVGDAATTMPGYDIRILPPSAEAQLFIYEALMRAAGAQP
jgi:hypothetical protein